MLITWYNKKGACIHEKTCPVQCTPENRENAKVLPSESFPVYGSTWNAASYKMEIQLVILNKIVYLLASSLSRITARETHKE